MQESRPESVMTSAATSVDHPTYGSDHITAVRLSPAILNTLCSPTLASDSTHHRNSNPKSNTLSRPRCRHYCFDPTYRTFAILGTWCVG